MAPGGGPQVRGTGKAVVEKRKAAAATVVDVSGAVVLVIRRGAPRLEVEAQKEILPHVKTSFDGGALKVWTEGSMSTNGPIRVRYTGPGVSSLEGSGAVEFDASGLGGSVSTIKLSGASKAKAEGRVGKLAVEASGASEADLKRLESESASVEANGASKVWVRTRGELRASASGASEVRYFGKPSRVRENANGASSVQSG